MDSEIKNCQNCKKDFTIEPDDFSFYKKIKVPPPTFCPECRFQRRLAWRNDRSLYKRNCSMCKNSIISMYPENKLFPVYCKDCFYGEGWDSTDYAIDYDFSKPFFEQFKKLLNTVPQLAIWQRNVVDSPYSNMVAESKNVYLSISVVLDSENIFYSWGIDKSFNIFDCHNVKESSNCYENIEGEKNYNCQNLFLSRNCIDSYYLVDCVNCSNCILSSNLRNKEFYFKNKPLTKEEYFKEVEKLNLSSKKSRKIISQEFKNIKNDTIYRFAHINKSINSTGNNLSNTKDSFSSFELFNTENVKYCYRVLNERDSMDVTYAGKAELMYEYLTGALNDYNVKFSMSAIDSVQNADYVEFCVSSKNLFGCIGVKNKSNVILNKVYTEEEFKLLREKIIKHMNEMPYIDKKGNVYKYGEFFPIEMSLYSYNETVAQDFFPLKKEEIINYDYKWKDSENKNFNISIKNEDIPDNINNVEDDILEEIIECSCKGRCNHKCSKAFKLIKDEFLFYKKNNIPIPDKCSNCRFYERLDKVLPPKLWHRTCMEEGCTNEFETSYSPERPEIVYCEKCYQQEVY